MTLRQTPEPYQAEGIAFLANRDRALLADEPGLGKTLQAIRAADAVNALRVLVVCPASLVAEWKRHIAQQSEGDWTATVVSFNRAAGNERVNLISRNARWDVCIIDEAHALKDFSAKRTRSLYGRRVDADKDSIVSRARRVWILTGTPMPNHAGELYPHLRALRPDLITGEKSGIVWSQDQFLVRYAKMRPTGFGNKIVGSQNEAELHAKLKDFMLRRRKSEVLKDLPPLRFTDVPLTVDTRAFPAEMMARAAEIFAKHSSIPSIRKELRRVSGLGAMREMLGSKTAAALAANTDPLTALQELARMEGVGEFRLVMGLAKAGPAADWINQWLADNPGRKIVVFGHHRTVLEALQDRLAHHNSVLLYGDTKVQEAARAIQKFQDDPETRVFIGNILKAGVGLTLTAASDLVFVESSWVPAEMAQAAQRIHRLGQKDPCVVRTMFCEGTVDEDIQMAIARKMASISKIVDGEQC